MNPNEYQALAMRTLCDQVAARNRLHSGVEATQVNHALIGLSGEVGELCGFWQKMVYYGKFVGPEEFKQKIADEAGDVLWYVAELLTAAGLTLEGVLAGNVAKLRARYPERYTDAAAADEARDRTAEAQAVAVASGTAAAKPATRPPQPLPGQWDHPETVPGDRSGS